MRDILTLDTKSLIIFFLQMLWLEAVGLDPVSDLWTSIYPNAQSVFGFILDFASLMFETCFS